jgi:hypothetical protein
VKSSSYIAIWPEWRKILFRFVVIFFPIEILNPGFIGTWFVGNYYLYSTGLNLLTPPFLWLNEHIFHFYYHPESWTPFSWSLALIRFMASVLVSLTGCIVWTLLDRDRINFERFEYWFNQVLCVCLSVTVLAYGVIKIIPVQMVEPSFISLHQPVGDLSPFELIWTTLGYGQPFEIFSGIGETLGGIAILFRRTRLAGLMLLLFVFINVSMFNYTWVIGVQELSLVLTLMILYLLVPYLQTTFKFFFSTQPVSATSVPVYHIETTWKRYIITGIAALLILSTVSSNLFYAFKTYKNRSLTLASRKYSELKEFTIVGNTVTTGSELPDSLQWRYWNERKVNDRILVTLTMKDVMISETWALKKDSIPGKIFLTSIKPGNSTRLQFTVSNFNNATWGIEGLWEGLHIKARWQQFDPQQKFKLSRVRREFFMRDRDE